MANSTQPTGLAYTTALRLAPKVGVLVSLAAVLGAASFVVPHMLASMSLAILAGTLVVMAGISGLAKLFQNRIGKRSHSAASEFIAHDSVVSFFTDFEGVIEFRNEAARKRFEHAPSIALASTLKVVFANPGAVIFRLQNRVQSTGSAREDIVTRQGHIRLSVHRVGADKLLWRLEELADRASPSRTSEGGQLPMLTVGRNDAVLFMNDGARRLVGQRAKSLDRIFPELPLRSGRVNKISTPEGTQTCLVVEVDGKSGRREIFLLPQSVDGDARPEGWQFFDELPVPLLKVAPDGAILLSNRLARTLLGIEDQSSARLPDLMEGLGRSILDWLDEAAQGRGLQHSEFLRLTRADKEVFVQVNLSRVAEPNGATLIAVVNDATELKTLEAQFVQSQKMQAIGQLAGGVAHDFNNLLTAISGHCDLLLLRHDQGDPDFADLVQINQNANRAAALVGQLLAFSRKQTLQPEVLDLRDTLSDLTHLLNRLVGEKITLSLSHEPMLKSVRADKRQLEQVLMNLVVNARDAMPNGGEISVETENLTLKEPLCRDHAVVAPGEYVSVKVSDDGIGIATDKLQKVFEPFVTTKRPGEGTGLGLSTAYGIVKQTGGYIFVDSVVGTGTCFMLLFPAHEHSAQGVKSERPVVAAPMPLKHADGVVLLVEDEAPVRAFAARALRLRGYTVIEADSAEEALLKLQDKSLTVDIFVTDVVMPGMDGPSWVRQALEDRPGVRVVFVSGYAEEAFGENRARIPNSVFLPKPFSLAELTETVQRQLH